MHIILLAREYHEATGMWASREYIDNIDIGLRQDVLELDDRIDYYRKGGGTR